MYEYKPLGVFIEGVSGKLYTSNEWNSQETPNGIAVIAEKCRFVMSLLTANGGTFMKINEDATVVPSDLTPHSEGLAKVDYGGYINTQIMKDIYGSDARYAVGACINYTFPNGQNGYLPSLGEMRAIASNFDSISNLLTVLQSHIEEGLYWTSTRHEGYGDLCGFWACEINDASGWCTEEFYTNDPCYVIPITSIQL